MHNFQSTRRRRSSRQVFFELNSVLRQVQLWQFSMNISQSDGDCDQMNRQGFERTGLIGTSLDTIEEKVEVST